MSLPAQAGSRLLPFDRDEPGSWQRWENFWVDFLNAEPLLPWPGDPALFKRVKIAEKYGVAGGSQDGIDIRAYMDDGTILAVQCKDYARFDPAKGKAAMNKAEKAFTDAQAYILVLTQPDVSNLLQKEADRRGNWRVIGRDTLSSWFFSGKFLDLDSQTRLVSRHFGPEWLRALFPLPGDHLLISAERFFQQKNLIRHDAQLQGEASLALAESLAAAMCGGRPKISILTATGGQGKSRMLKAVAERVAERSSDRVVRFQNDSADSAAEDYGLRAEDFKNAGIFIDDAHRLENLRPRLLRQISESPTATLLIAARPNNTEALKKKLLESGFQEADWAEHPLPSLDHSGRRALAVEILGNDDGKTPDFLAGQSGQCPLVCTVGAELIRAGKIDLLDSDDFKRRVFDHLMDSSLDSLFAENPSGKERAERVLRILSMLNPVEGDDELFKQVARLEQCQPWDIDRLVPQLESAGLLRKIRGKFRVIPDLLADHLVYDTAYGKEKMPSLVREVISMPIPNAFANLFGNLAEAEWRAKQEGNADSYLEGMWESLRELLSDAEDQRIFGLLDAWRKFAIFQPERTLELARILLDHEAARVASGNAERRYRGFRYDPIAMHLGKIPDLLAPVARHHKAHRRAAFDLLWETGRIKDVSTQSQDELPAAWRTIAGTASLGGWENDGPRDAFEWLKMWVYRPEGRANLEDGRPFLSHVTCQWFESRGFRTVKDAETIRAHHSGIRDFRNEVLGWIESEIIPAGPGPCWSALPVIYAAGYARSGAPDALASTVLYMLRQVLALYKDPLLRLSVWQFLSKKAAADDQGLEEGEWLKLRNSIARDLPFQLVRLANSFARPEWDHELLHRHRWEKSEDFDAMKQWWSDLASQTVNNLRRDHPSIQASIEEIDRANESLARFRQRASWDAVAAAWSQQYPKEREAILEEMMTNPGHALVPALGYYLGLRDEINSAFAEHHALHALTHPDDRVRRAVLLRLSWRDVKRSDAIAAQLKKMAASKDPGIVSAMASYISWNQYEATPYFDEVLSSLNVRTLSPSELVGVAESIASLMEYKNWPIHPDLLEPFFKRLEQEEDLNKVFPDHALSVFHEKFPVEMFKVHLARIRSGKLLPWLLEDWFLAGLPAHLGDAEFRKTADDLLDEALGSDEDHFHQFNQLFDVSVARVSPELTAELLTERLRKQPLSPGDLKKIVDLTGAGNGSVVYDCPQFTRELLDVITLRPALEAKELRDALIFGATPNQLGWTNGELDQEYLWARDQAAKLVEEHRADPVLRDFFRDIVNHQEQQASRIRHLRDD